ncbi:carboxyl transferase domain-containing protein [Pseudonocardia spinosispora]|uniref:carboxyl transferase domain-containing protein n=1 Tax=Pseudonocardia spinosispora TaxID=103441 RepID=UPI0003FD694B|nr:carboxyl transferase domain-containing protein [Pseudonocardia spinosispora]
MPVTRLLVANRGEIAVRILHTAAALGISTVGVFAEDDADSGRADESIALDGTGPAAYLDVEALVGVARQTGCDAVHPGYGFLSERADFAQACEVAGLTFVGPSPDALRLFGDKIAARVRAVELDIAAPDASPVLTDDFAPAHDFFASAGAVMVKAVAGGGGRGIRPVTDAAQLDEVLRRCRSEARNAFGNGDLYLEKLLTNARHIEVQLAGDHTGAVVALGDRDCSLQRRRQKLIEVAPAPGLSDHLRDRLRKAATALGASVDRLGLATVEFLVAGDDIAFLEVNPRIQVEHTVTEEVTGLDLIELQLRLAGGATLDQLGLTDTPEPRGVAVQARVNAETMDASGDVRPAGGLLTRFDPPTGRGVRVDTHCAANVEVSPRYDSLIAKVIVTGTDLARANAATDRALSEFRVEGSATNIGLLRALLRTVPDEPPHTGYVDDHLAQLLEAEPLVSVESGYGHTQRSRGDAVVAPRAGVVVELPAAVGEHRAEGAAMAVLEAMKMEHVVPAPGPVQVREVLVAIGDTVVEGTPLLLVDPAESAEDDHAGVDDLDLDHIRPDLAESIERHRTGLDEARPEAVAKRRDKGRRTARECLARLCDPDTFVEYGALAVAAQRRRRTMADLIARTPADGMITGTARINGLRCAVLVYDYTVLAGTQGVQNHRKTDRLLELAKRERIPVVMFVEGGGGRPGDTDQPGYTGLDVPTFRLAAELATEVPTVAVLGGYCFAGNAALAGVCDVLIAQEGSSIGMGGPAMISGGGLGDVAPGDVGPMSVQVPNGVVDVLVPDDFAAVDVAKQYLSYVSGPRADWEAPDQRLLRHLIPENRVRSYQVRPVLDALFDTGSVLELRPEFGIGVVTAFARLAGNPVGVIANNPMHLGGAIDAEASDKAARFLGVCGTYRLPVISLCDTPGFMVGPDAERTATVRRFGAMFVAGAHLPTPLVMVVLRKGYGLGAMAMAGGGLRSSLLTVAWPTGEFGGMGLEGSVQLGYRAELGAIDDPDAREARYQELVARAYEHGKALSTATVFDIDDVIDPADTRAVLTSALGFIPG